ncbi:MAG: Cobalamin biosynthesis protein CbiB [Methanonatronarchaeales archaeon]|nr:Cobalamin biosynthesis protein CbiB [Methanonatronarchaeales archaeon]
MECLEPRATGLAGGAAITALALGLAVALSLLPRLLTGWTELLAAALLLNLSVSAASLEREIGRAAASPLEERRIRASHLVSRDVSGMDEGLLNSALLESLSENATDSVFTPLLYFALLGLPGALAYRALDTVDSMLGYPSEGRGGLVPARLEDAATAVPALLVLLPLSAAALATGGPSAARRGISSCLRFGRSREGFNGWAMAFYAGALDVSLEKPGSYVMNPGRLPDAGAAGRGVRLSRATLLFTLPVVAGLLFIGTALH